MTYSNIDRFEDETSQKILFRAMMEQRRLRKFKQILKQRHFMEKVTTKCLTKVPQRGERRGQRTERHVICKASDGSLIPPDDGKRTFSTISEKILK